MQHQLQLNYGAVRVCIWQTPRWEGGIRVVMRRRRHISFFCFFFLMSGLFCCGVASSKTVPSLCRLHHPSDDHIEFQCYRIKKGETLEKLFGNRWIDVARFNRVDRRHVYQGISIKVPNNPDVIKDFSPLPKFYQPAEKEKKFILVDLSEQFLGAYEFGHLVFSAPIATGEKRNETPSGEFMITAIDRRHVSSLYFVEKTNKRYPMHYGLRFHISKRGVTFWIHGRDLPGYSASHGCIGLYDEEMQKKYYGYPKTPLLEDARNFFEWVISPAADNGEFHVIKDGPRIVIMGRAPAVSKRNHIRREPR